MHIQGVLAIDDISVLTVLKLCTKYAIHRQVLCPQLAWLPKGMQRAIIMATVKFACKQQHNWPKISSCHRTVLVTTHEMKAIYHGNDLFDPYDAYSLIQDWGESLLALLAGCNDGADKSQDTATRMWTFKISRQSVCS